MAAADCRCVLTAKDNGGSRSNRTRRDSLPRPPDQTRSGSSPRRTQDTDGKTLRLAGVADRPSKHERGGHRPTTKGRNDAIARVKLTSARGVVNGLRPVRLTDPNTGEAIPTSLVADDKGPFGFEHGTAPPQPRHTRVKTQTTDPEPRPESGHSKD